MAKWHEVADEMSRLAGSLDKVIDWMAAPPLNHDLTWAVLQGAYAAEDVFAKSSDNPYSRGSVWRWAWWTGFDLGGRIETLLDMLAKERGQRMQLIAEWRARAEVLNVESIKLFGPEYKHHRGMVEMLRFAADQLEEIGESNAQANPTQADERLDAPAGGDHRDAADDLG